MYSVLSFRGHTVYVRGRKNRGDFVHVYYIIVSESAGVAGYDLWFLSDNFTTRAYHGKKGNRHLTDSHGYYCGFRFLEYKIEINFFALQLLTVETYSGYAMSIL